MEVTRQAPVPLRSSIGSASQEKPGTSEDLIAAEADPAPGPARTAEPVRASPGSEWDRILEAAGSYRRLRVVLGDSSLVRLDAQRVVIRVPESLRAVVRASERELLAVVASALGRSVAVEIEAPAPEAAPPEAGEAEAVKATRTPADQEPLVRQAMELFGARLVSVTGRPGAG
ncbi:MAG: hypothetical protein IPM33_04625 [Phycisphaerales bacterium]|nr:hypothetical protein [Phycisphaerales bacterium]